MKIVLASSSPRRRELLTMVGMRPVVIHPEADENRHPEEKVEEFLERVAVAKGMSIYKNPYYSDLLISADTIVLLGDRVIGKPTDREDARKMLKDLSRKSHEVLTGIALIHKGETRFAISRTRVFFRTLTIAEIDHYLDHEEYLDKAGAYAIQGRAAVFAERIEGCYFNVMGFPLALFHSMLTLFGLDPSAFTNADPKL